jgi:hypothetical protein
LLIRGNPIEGEASGKGAAKLSQSRNRRLSRAIAADLELPRAGYPDFDLVALLKLQCVDHCGRQADGKTVPPL